MGIARSREALADAALVLVVLDATETLNHEERNLLDAIQGRPALVAVNKSDLVTESQYGSIFELFQQSGIQAVATSALTGSGIPELRDRIVELATGGAASEPGMLTNLRQHRAIATTLSSLTDADAANTNAVPHEMILIDLYRALWALDSLTGQTTADDILNLIFSTFCIGK